MSVSRGPDSAHSNSRPHMQIDEPHSDHTFSSLKACHTTRYTEGCIICSYFCFTLPLLFCTQVFFCMTTKVTSLPPGHLLNSLVLDASQTKLIVSYLPDQTFFPLRQKLPKVNKELALKLMEEGDDEAELASRKKKGKVGARRLEREAAFLLVFPVLWIHLFQRHTGLGWGY